jgi:hypothetical protein
MTKAGRAIYALRKTIVEPVFGQIKQAQGFRQFLAEPPSEPVGWTYDILFRSNVIER